MGNAGQIKLSTDLIDGAEKLYLKPHLIQSTSLNQTDAYKLILSAVAVGKSPSCRPLLANTHNDSLTMTVITLS